MLLGVALRSAIAMGLHRHLPSPNINPIEEQTRRRVFHVIRQQDIYLSSILGSPLLLSEDDFDQAYPEEVDDEYVTKDGITYPGTPSFLQAFNARVRLMGILAKVVRHVYPLNSIREGYAISYARITEIEGDLQTWNEELPQIWQPKGDHSGPVEIIRQVITLLLSFPS